MKKEGIAAYHTHLKEIFRTADSDDDDAFTFLIHADLSLHNEDSRRSLPPRRHHRYRPSSSAQRSRAERRMRGSARSTPPEPLEPWPPSPSLPCSHSPPSPNLNPTTRLGKWQWHYVRISSYSGWKHKESLAVLL
ncbi:hypothetical protein SORBI_3003G174850 [Sorghum bicolor]|uniref:Uncharacterized protein n=1 Tax=Sorghum bicolor TaxID=4558 RepID=A0A1W0VXT4_SORBI|nr:hypothetical protein SORBI_3003G174850 [Sorghum bicolor]OQU86939.1 hypothetical protein SORBI_3003G174850 [Sorghum bicolor]